MFVVARTTCNLLYHSTCTYTTYTLSAVVFWPLLFQCLSLLVVNSPYPQLSEPYLTRVCTAMEPLSANRGMQHICHFCSSFRPLTVRCKFNVWNWLYDFARSFKIENLSSSEYVLSTLVCPHHSITLNDTNTKCVYCMYTSVSNRTCLKHIYEHCPS